jgi:protein TonB
LFSLGAFGKESANYAMSVPSSTSAVNVELLAPRAQVQIEEPLAALPQEIIEPIIPEIKEKEFVVPKKKIEKIKKLEKVTQAKTPEIAPVETKNTTDNSQSLTQSVDTKNISDQSSLGTEKVTDLQAAYLRNPPQTYPQGSRMSKEEGLVLLLVSIDSAGEVSDISIKKTSGFSRLDRAALQAVSAWVFKPTTFAGIPVADKVEVPIRFE